MIGLLFGFASTGLLLFITGALLFIFGAVIVSGVYAPYLSSSTFSL
jgi:hypothetical protein